MTTTWATAQTIRGVMDKQLASWADPEWIILKTLDDVEQSRIDGSQAMMGSGSVSDLIDKLKFKNIPITYMGLRELQAECHHRKLPLPTGSDEPVTIFEPAFADYVAEEVWKRIRPRLPQRHWFKVILVVEAGTEEELKTRYPDAVEIEVLRP